MRPAGHDSVVMNQFLYGTLDESRWACEQMLRVLIDRSNQVMDGREQDFAEAELGSVDRQRAATLSKAMHQHQRPAQFKLERLASEPQYDPRVCVRCAKRITAQRLRARPESMMCVACKQALEQERVRRNR